MSSPSTFIAVTNRYVSGKGGNFDLLNINQKVGWKFSFKIISKVVDPFITDPRVKQSGLVSSVSSITVFLRWLVLKSKIFGQKSIKPLCFVNTMNDHSSKRWPGLKKNKVF